MTALLLTLLAAAPDVNLLSLESGTVAIETPPSFGGAWSPESLVDGDPSTGWCSQSGAKGPWRFVFELEQRSALTALEADTSSSEEPGYPGISAKTIELWISEGGAPGSFTRVASVPVPKHGRAKVALPKQALGRFVQLVVVNNHGHASYTELMEVAVLGHPLEPSSAPAKSIAGTWALEGGGLVRLAEDGSTLSGCAVQGGAAWRLRGSIAGRVAKTTLEELDGTAGTSLLVSSSDGNVLRGRWRASGAGAWTAKRRPGPEADCTALLEQVSFERRLAASGDAVTLRGIGFDANDELKLDTRNELAALAGLLTSHPGSRARMLVLGRTTEIPADELKRCERRAQAVLQFLLKRGVTAESVELGVGLLKLGGVQPEPRVEVKLTN